MEVFLIPLGGDRYELYCEPATEPDTDDGPAAGGVTARLRRRFASMLRAAEQRQHMGTSPAKEPTGWLARAQERMMAWVVERIAEQRLLWHLRRHAAAVAVHPQDVQGEQALTIVLRVLQRDYDRHRRWLIIDAIILVASAALAIVPGPNLVAYYFAFRVWGHWLSMRGAAQGLRGTVWTAHPCSALSDLRDLSGLEPHLRIQRIREIAARLRLQHLATFFDRVAVDANRPAA